MNRLRRQASCQQASRSSTPSSREGLDALEVVVGEDPSGNCGEEFGWYGTAGP
jgi:hypothetical protein